MMNSWKNKENFAKKKNIYEILEIFWKFWENFNKFKQI